LKNLYVFFWRWASWKVFGSDMLETTGQAAVDRGGIVCFITVAGFLNGPGFQQMRADLRRDCSKIWVIDCSPEGHQPVVNTRIFEGVQHPVCIVLAARAAGKDRTVGISRVAPAGSELRLSKCARTDPNRRTGLLQILHWSSPIFSMIQESWKRIAPPPLSLLWAI